MHDSTFEHLTPTPDQLEAMAHLRAAAKEYATALNEELPEGPDKTFIMRSLRTLSMWVNVAITRLPDGSPRK